MPRRGWLVDNQVPRGVTRLLRTSGHDTVEVRSVLGGEDRDFAGRRRAAGRPTVWLRTLQTEDGPCLQGRLTDVIDAIDAGATQLVLTRDGALEIEP